MKLFSQTVIIALCIAGFATAEEPAAQAPAEAAPAPVVLKATDREGLKAAVDKTATVTGKIQRANAWDGGITFLNLEGGFTVVCFKKNYGKFPSPPDQLFAQGKTIEVTGKVKLHKDRPEIEITGPDQIKVIADAPAAPPAAAPEAPKEEKKAENP
ncbi:MAG: hypothetical protein ACKO2G_09860 [Verrucomicrobiales bacterium]